MMVADDKTVKQTTFVASAVWLLAAQLATSPGVRSFTTPNGRVAPLVRQQRQQKKTTWFFCPSSSHTTSASRRVAPLLHMALSPRRPDRPDRSERRRRRREQLKREEAELSRPMPEAYEAWPVPVQPDADGNYELPVSDFWFDVQANMREREMLAEIHKEEPWNFTRFHRWMDNYRSQRGILEGPDDRKVSAQTMWFDDFDPDEEMAVIYEYDEDFPWVEELADLLFNIVKSELEIALEATENRRKLAALPADDRPPPSADDQKIRKVNWQRVFIAPERSRLWNGPVAPSQNADKETQDAREEALRDRIKANAERRRKRLEGDDDDDETTTTTTTAAQQAATTTTTPVATQGGTTMAAQQQAPTAKAAETTPPPAAPTQSPVAAGTTPPPKQQQQEPAQEEEEQQPSAPRTHPEAPGGEMDLGAAPMPAERRALKMARGGVAPSSRRATGRAAVVNNEIDVNGTLPFLDTEFSQLLIRSWLPTKTASDWFHRTNMILEKYWFAPSFPIPRHLLIGRIPPNTSTTPRSDLQDFLLTVHIPLKGKFDRKVGLDIAGERHAYAIGEPIIFDSTHEYSVYNDGDETAYFLHLDIWQPEITPRDRSLLSHFWRTWSDDFQHPAWRWRHLRRENFKKQAERREKEIMRRRNRRGRGRGGDGKRGGGGSIARK